MNFSNTAFDNEKVSIYTDQIETLEIQIYYIVLIKKITAIQYQRL